MNVEELLKDEEFVSSVSQANSLVDISHLMQGKGIYNTELNAILKSIIATEDEELDERVLDNVAGGVSVPSLLRRILFSQKKPAGFGAIGGGSR